MNLSLRLLVSIVFVTTSAVANTADVSSMARKAVVQPVSDHSTVRLPLEISYSTIQALVNEKAPQVVSGTKDDPTNAMYDDTLRYTIHRGAIKVSAGSNCMSISMPINGSATAHGRVGARGWLGRRIASTSLRETAHFNGTVRGCVSLNVHPDWTLSSDVKLDLDLDRAEVRLIRNLIPVSFRGLVIKEFNERKDAIVRDISNQIVKSLDVQRQVTDAWAALHTVYQINKNPAVFARIEPQRIVFQPLNFDHTDAVSVGIGLVARIQTTLGAKPQTPQVAPLPAPEPTANLPATSTLRVPVVIEFDAVNSALAKRLAEAPVAADAHGKLMITGARLMSMGSRAGLQLNYDVQRVWYLPNISGELTLVGQPYYDPNTQILEFKNLDFTIATRTRLIKEAAHLLKPVILTALASRAKIELAPHLATLRSVANQQALALIPQESGGVVDLQQVQIDDVIVRNGVLIATVAGDVISHIRLAGGDAKLLK